MRVLSPVLPLLACLAAFACAKRTVPPPPPPPAAAPPEAAPPAALEDLFWTSYGQDGAVLLRIQQTARARKTCRVTVLRGGGELWSADRCLATRAQMRFLSPDGERLLVLNPDPEVNGPAADVELGVLYARAKRVRRYTVGEVLGGSQGARIEAGTLRWLHSELPKEVAGGVRITLADGRGEFLFFDGSGVPNSGAAPVRLQAGPIELSAARR